jgi:hypothetical protein
MLLDKLLFTTANVSGYFRELTEDRLRAAERDDLVLLGQLTDDLLKYLQGFV